VARQAATRAAKKARAQRGDQPTALGGAAALGRQAEGALVREEVVDDGAIGRIERDRHRARRVVTEGAPRRRLQLGGEGGPEPGALEAQRRERGLAVLHLVDGGEHPGRHPPRAVVARVRRDDRHAMTVA